MHSTSKLGEFMTLRANGWSLDKIAKHINVCKTTLWRWDVKNQAEIHLLKHMQLERVQEQYLPSYEDELKSVSGQLNRIEEALSKHDLSTMTPAFLMQMSLQYRDRLSRMRQQAPLRTVQMGPIEPLPVTGCVTNNAEYPWIDGDPAIEAADDAAEAAEAAEAARTDTAAAPAAGPAPAQASTSEGRVTTSPRPTIQVPPLPTSGNHANGNGKPHHNGHTNGKHNGNGKPDSNGSRPSPDSTSPARQSVVSPESTDISVHSSSFVVGKPENKKEQNGTKREGGQKFDPSTSTTSENQK